MQQMKARRTARMMEGRTQKSKRGEEEVDKT